MEDFKAMEEEEEEGLEKVVEKSFVITFMKKYISHMTIRSQHIHLVSVVGNLIMW